MLVMGFVAFVGWFAWNSEKITREQTSALVEQIESASDTSVKLLVGQFVTALPNLKEEDAQKLGGRIIEKMQSTTNTDQMSALEYALATITHYLKPEKAQTLAGSILPRIQSTTDAAPLSALTRGFAVISAQLPPETARALVDPILQAIKGQGNSSQRHALGLALAAIATQLKPEEEGPLEYSIAKAFGGGQTVPLPPAADERRPTPKTGKPAE